MADKRRILIADDNQPNRELLEAYLAGIDCETQIAIDGQDTLAKVQSFRPDLILLDVMMPKLSGFEVCQKLKADPATRKIMVLMVTALNEAGDIERAVKAGTDDFLSKPVNRVELTKRVENMLKLYHVTDENERLRRYIEEMENRGGNTSVTRQGSIDKVDKGVLSLKTETGEHSIHVGSAVNVSLNGSPARLGDLKVGDIAKCQCAERDGKSTAISIFATRVASK